MFFPAKIVGSHENGIKAGFDRDLPSEWKSGNPGYHLERWQFDIADVES